MSILLIAFWFVFLFVLGTVIGSFLNVCIARLPAEKSLGWPGSHCGKCFQPVRWYDNMPLLSYLILRGRCRICGARFSIRYFLVELLTGLGFVGLFYLEMVVNIHQWPPVEANWAVNNGFYPWHWWIGFSWHALLFSFLVAAAFCDLHSRIIPLSITLTGTAVGLLGALLFPWPWPHEPSQPILKPMMGKASPALLHELEKRPWHDLRMNGYVPQEGLYPWPVWGPLPNGLRPGSWQLGLATGLIGLLVGTMMMRTVAFLFGKGLGKEALGLGDADLMMMAGAFLGWQPVVVAFLVSVIPGLLFGLYQLVIHKDKSLPFGPSLAVGIIITFLCWRWIGPQVQLLFFWGGLLFWLAVAAALFMFASSYFIRLMNPPAKAA